MSENAAMKWMDKYNAIVAADYRRRSQPLPEPQADGVYKFAPASVQREAPAVSVMPSACYRAKAGFMVHVRPSCRCPQ